MYATAGYPPRAEFIDPIDLVPVLGTINRGKRITKGTLRTYRWLKRRRVPPAKRVVASGVVGAHQMLRAQRIFPYGAALNAVHAGGRGAVRAARAGKGARGATNAFLAGSGGALATSKTGLERAFQPAISYQKGFRRTYRMLGDEVPKGKRIGASNAIGTRQVMKETKGLKRFYGVDRRGRRIVRSVQHKGRKLRRWVKRN